MHLKTIQTANEEEFTQKAVDTLSISITSAIKTHNSCMLGLSGGSTPKKIYEELGKVDLDWSKVIIFLADERYIPPTDECSNQKLVRDTLLQSAAIPEEHLLFPDTNLPLEACVENFAAALQDMIDTQKRVPDIITLGLGTDGHIASLFPLLDDQVLANGPLALHTTTDQFDVEDRMSVALPVIATTQHHVFLLKGKDKKNTWEEMMASDEDEKRWPAKRILKHATSTLITLW